MTNFIQILIGLGITLLIFIILIFLFGITITRKGHVSIMEKKHEFYCVEIRKISYYLPLLFHKVRSYPTEVATIRVNGHKIKYQIVDYMKLYKSKRKLKDIIANANNLKVELNNFGVTLIEIK